MYYQLIATLAGDRRKSIPNKTEDQVLADYIVPYVSGGTISARWGNRTKTYQVVQLRVFKTLDAWDKKSGRTLEKFIGKKKNLFNTFEKKANKILGMGSRRCFVVMPIQGEKYGNQSEQRIFKEYDERFEAIETAVSDFKVVAIRIDKEHPLDDIVGRIKKEIKACHFVIADLTDERPSCYFEVGYAEALGCPIIYIASKESVISPPSKTKIHFDIHMNVNFFSNHKEMVDKIRTVIEKNQDLLFKPKEELVLKA
ncbi:MAG: hypothetical protein PHY31_03605 [Smithellaceae bacterium]|nr:hypothetical protein [Smithellaceae bacterium]